MILTKEEFQNTYKLSSIQAVYKLIRQNKIKLNSDGLIDVASNDNASYCSARAKKIEDLYILKNKAIENSNNKQNEQKFTNQLALEIDLLNARLDEKIQRSALMKLKIAKETKEVVETSVLNKCIQAIFTEIIKTMPELPNIYAADIVRIVQSEDEPKGVIIDFLTQKIVITIKNSIEAAKEKVKKSYGCIDKDKCSK